MISANFTRPTRGAEIGGLWDVLGSVLQPISFQQSPGVTISTVFSQPPPGIVLSTGTETRPRTVGTAGTAPTSGSGNGESKIDKIANIVATVVQGFGKRPLYNPATVNAPGMAAGIDAGVNTGGGAGSPARGLGADTGATVGKLGDKITASVGGLVERHPLAAVSIVGFVAYELFRQRQGKRPARS